MTDTRLLSLYRQKKIEEKCDSCFANDEEYVGSPNGIDETTLKSILNNVFEKHPDQIIFTTSAQKLQAVIMNLPYGVVAMNFQNPFLSKMRKRVF